MSGHIVIYNKDDFFGDTLINAFQEVAQLGDQWNPDRQGIATTPNWQAYLTTGVIPGGFNPTHGTKPRNKYYTLTTNTARSDMRDVLRDAVDDPARTILIKQLINPLYYEDMLLLAGRMFQFPLVQINYVYPSSVALGANDATNVSKLTAFCMQFCDSRVTIEYYQENGVDLLQPCGVRNEVNFTIGKSLNASARAVSLANYIVFY